MENKSVIKILLSVSFFCLLVLSCSPEGVSKVTITIDLGLQNKAAFNAPESSSIIDRVLRFFAKDAEAQSAPNNLTSLTLNITGDGMDKITLGYTPPLPSTITVEVPAGDSRTFEILAYTPSATLRGVATRNLSGGATVAIPIQMALYETKIVIPDFRNNRVVQINESDTWSRDDVGFLEKNGDNYPLTTTIDPYDIDFDNSGKIYIANYTVNHNILLLNSFDETETFIRLIPDIYEPGEGYCTSIGIDRKNSYIYASDGINLYRWNLDGTNYYALTISGITGISGIDVSNNGLLYLTGNSGTTSYVPTVFKYDPTEQIITGTYTTNLTEPWDVIVKNGYLYIADYGEWSPNKIVQLSLDLNYINELLYMPGTENTLLGPHRFVAIINKKFYVIDENENDGPSENERIVAFDDFNSAWDSFIPSIAQGYFQFYGTC